MLIHKRDKSAPRHSEITSEAIWHDRRRFIKAGVAAGLIGTTGLPLQAETSQDGDFKSIKKSEFSTDEKLTRFEDVTQYNNFYEFGLDKEDPARYAHQLQTQPWQLVVEGEVAQSKVYDSDDLLTLAPLEERIYRLRCVEGWSMVIPWVGYSLSALLKQVQPTSKAKYVQFVTVNQSNNMRGLNSRVLNWPYTEALRIDEAMHPLTLLTLGLYGKVLPNQNGAPVRLVVPWKYGFKSAKSIVAIRLTEAQPKTAWTDAAPEEYGFYANVNPNVPHPRWSQATERRIGEDGFFSPKRETLLFNGYADQVASLYQGMDLHKYY